MKTVLVKHRAPLGSKEYTIYTTAEAKALGVAYKPWRGAQVGEYGLTDDGYVGICIRKWDNTYKNGKLRFTTLTFPMGTGCVLASGKLRRLEYLNRPSTDIYYFGQRQDSRWRVGLTKKEAAMCARIYALTLDPLWAFKFVRPWETDRHCKLWGTAFINTKQGREMVHKEVGDLLNDMGYTDEKTLELLQESLEMARKKQDCANFNRAVETLIGLRGLQKRRSEVKQTLQITGKLKDLIELEQSRMQEVVPEQVESQPATGEQEHANI